MANKNLTAVVSLTVALTVVTLAAPRPSSRSCPRRTGPPPGTPAFPGESRTGPPSAPTWPRAATSRPRSTRCPVGHRPARRRDLEPVDRPFHPEGHHREGPRARITKLIGANGNNGHHRDQVVPGNSRSPPTSRPMGSRLRTPSPVRRRTRRVTAETSLRIATVIAAPRGRAPQPSSVLQRDQQCHAPARPRTALPRSAPT